MVSVSVMGMLIPGLARVMLRTGMLFVNGWQTIPLEGLDPRRVLVTALASLQARRDDVE